MRNKYAGFIILGIFLLLGLTWLLVKQISIQKAFNGKRAFEDILTQVSFGPRTPGSHAHAMEVAFIITSLEQAGWQVSVQESDWNGFTIRNIIASRAAATQSLPILLGTHYDTRILADQEAHPIQGQGVPGANDGASGVAVLLELARTLPEDSVPVWLVFFDAEDNGGIEGWEWIIGSRAFASSMIIQPRAVVIVDMIGDADLQIPIEGNSDASLVEEIWSVAEELGYQQFLRDSSGPILDDHIPFLQIGIPAVDIIDLTYPYWHTLADTAEKVSPESLEAVGRTLWTWIVDQSP
jgi:Zn-dependent M28 family amino/carboxypeptidase